MKLSFCTGVYEKFPITIEEVIKRVSSYGYEGIEFRSARPHIFPGDFNKSQRRRLKELLESYGLKACAMHRTYPPELSIISPDERVRLAAIRHTRDVAELAADLEAGVIVLGWRNAPESLGLDRAWKNALESLKDCGRFLRDLNVILAVEPLNRYETWFINTAREALNLVKEVRSESIQVMLDTFHMNIEEASPLEAIKEAAERLVHVHIADSNRQAPGRGHIDFKEVFSALKRIKYGGYLSMEVDPVPDPDTAALDSINFLSPLIK